MWALYLLLHIWLSGSLLLPFMLLVCWTGKKWKGLYVLTHDRKRWLFIWGCFGLLKTIAFEGLLWSRYFPEFPFDFLAWADMAVWSFFNLLRIRGESLLIEFLLGLSFRAIVEAAIDVGFAALVWWIYSMLSQTRTHQGIAAPQRYGISLLVSACALGIANHVHSLRPVTCFDCFWPHGVPFTFFHEGGFAGGEGFVWSGVIGDALVFLVFGAVLGWVWDRLSQRSSIA